jgi:hypothetical protein
MLANHLYIFPLLASFSRPCLSTFLIKKKAITDTILMPSNRALTDTRAQRTKNRETPKNHIHQREKHNNNKEQQQATSESKNLAEITQMNLKKNYTTTGTKICNTGKVAKHLPDQPTTAAKHPSVENSNQRRRRQSIRQHSSAAKHPPTKRGAAKHPPTNDHCDLDDVEKTKRRQVQKWISFEKRI